MVTSYTIVSHMFEFQTSFVPCPIAEIRHSDEINLKDMFYSGPECKMATLFPLPRSREPINECVIVLFPFFIYIVKDPSQRAVPPTIGRSSHGNYCNQDTSTGVLRGISQVTLDSIS